jgi:FkbM family methyltransferase
MFLKYVERLVKVKLFKIIFASILLISLISLNENYLAAKEKFIVVRKKNVKYKFVKVDEETDNFTKNIFKTGEEEKFTIFEAEKNPEAIAIDLGAWIGTSSIWLSKNFHHVLAVEPDTVSLGCLQNNLIASGCSNVLICDKPVSEKSKMCVFGPRERRLNQSHSHIKDALNNPYDYFVKSMTFKQLIHDYIYANPEIQKKKISFIKCNIEGGEESILEDILHFAYNNGCKVYVTFHLDKWQQKKIEDYEYLFHFFKTNCPSLNLSQYLKENPSTSIFFEPNKEYGTLVKKNIPVFVISYNQYTFIKNIVKQLEKFTTDINIIDNNSDYLPLLEYFKNEYEYTLLKQKVNYGYSVYLQKKIQKLAGDLYVLTDPDLQFNSKLPENFMEELLAISNYYKANKVGFALLIDSEDIRTDITFKGRNIKDWESQFWINRIKFPLKPEIEIYKAPLDTTFCLINRNYSNPSIRVGGDFTCIHIPWHKNFQIRLEEGEGENYMKNNNSTNWFGKD